MQLILEKRLNYLFDTLKKIGMDRFNLSGSLGTEAIAVKPSMAPVRFDLGRGLLPLALFEANAEGWIGIDKAVNLGLITAIFVASEGNIDDHKRFDLEPNWANIMEPDFLWFEIVSRFFRRYEAYHISRTEPIPELVPIPDDKITLRRDLFGDIFKLHS